MKSDVKQPSEHVKCSFGEYEWCCFEMYGFQFIVFFCFLRWISGIFLRAQVPENGSCTLQQFLVDASRRGRDENSVLQAMVSIIKPSHPKRSQTIPNIQRATCKVERSHLQVEKIQGKVGFMRFCVEQAMFGFNPTGLFVS